MPAMRIRGLRLLATLRARARARDLRTRGFGELEQPTGLGRELGCLGSVRVCFRFRFAVLRLLLEILRSCLEVYSSGHRVRGHRNALSTSHVSQLSTLALACVLQGCAHEPHHSAHRCIDECTREHYPALDLTCYERCCERERVPTVAPMPLESSQPSRLDRT